MAYKCGGYDCKLQDNSNVPCFLKGVGSIVQATSYVGIKANKKHGSSVCMYVPDDSATVDILVDVCY